VKNDRRLALLLGEKANSGGGGGGYSGSGSGRSSSSIGVGGGGSGENRNGGEGGGGGGASGNSHGTAFPASSSELVARGMSVVAGTTNLPLEEEEGIRPSEGSEAASEAVAAMTKALESSPSR